MAEEKKDSFPWVQLIATIGTIVAALIGITPYILKLNQPSSSPQTPTIVFVTLPPAVVTPTPASTTLPVTTAETTPVPAQTTIVNTVATTGPPPGPAITIMVNPSSVLQGDSVMVSGSTDPAVPRVAITLTNSTGFRSVAVPVTLTQGAFQVQIGTSDYAPGDYTINASVPDTQATATASFTLSAPGTQAPTTLGTTVATTTAETTMAPTTVETTIPVTPTPTTAETTVPATTTTPTPTMAETAVPATTPTPTTTTSA